MVAFPFQLDHGSEILWSLPSQGVECYAEPGIVPEASVAESELAWQLARYVTDSRAR
jgi:hypothetical protein